MVLGDLGTVGVGWGDLGTVEMGWGDLGIVGVGWGDLGTVHVGWDRGQHIVLAKVCLDHCQWGRLQVVINHLRQERTCGRCV